MRVEEIRPGMHLTRDVYDPNGQILMRAGAQLTERHIKAFRAWGIQEAPVCADEEIAEEPIRDPKAIMEIRALLDTQFSLSNRDHPVVQALYDLCLDRFLGRG